ncbi:MAG: 3-hydroxyacyl-CoA dehydrogenase family protein [Chitinophagaceae bacterium]
MNVLVLANDVQKAELLYLPLKEGIQISWIKETAGYTVDQPIDACIDLLFEHNAERIEWLKNLFVVSDGQAPLIIINSVITTLEDIKEKFIRINGWNTFLKRSVIEAAGHDALLKVKAEEVFSNLNRKTEWVPDIAGFITARVIGSIINEAFYALQENVSSEEEIDTAMTLGTNYPYGPFEWGKIIGLQPIYLLLAALSNEQSHYQPSILLKKQFWHNNGNHPEY